MLKLLLINIVFFASLSNLEAQSFELQKHYADSLFQAEKYFDAITEYKRLLYFDKLNNYNYSANLKIGMSYKAGAKFNEAIKYFSIAKKNCAVDSNIIKVELEIIKSNILRGTIPKAIQKLSELQKQYPNVIDSTEIYYWSGWAYMLGDDWVSASNEFAKIDMHNQLKILADSVASEKYSVTFAKIASFIIPGFGQFYTGNYLSGIMSLGWNVLWGYLTINAFITDRAVEGILIGGLLWTRFYRGNFQNAEKFAINKNREISKKGFNYLQYEYRGEKP